MVILHQEKNTLEVLNAEMAFIHFPLYPFWALTFKELLFFFDASAEKLRERETTVE